MRVLVVDDSQVIRTIIIKELRDLGIVDIEQAEEGMTAMRKISSKSFELITLDITMPEADGITVLKHIKVASPNSRVIMCTAHNHKDVVMEAINIGIDDYIIKPFAVERLNEVLQKQIELIRRDGTVGNK
ncbi:response regulator [Anaerospora sp.]|uniref:response regulator n=1 Tax=Anaerospora sp. TaxID=1960278 RepID=UPI00289CEEFE|nr:response regulator [Anaerospora sp.]